MTVVPAGCIPGPEVICLIPFGAICMGAELFIATALLTNCPLWLTIATLPGGSPLFIDPGILTCMVPGLKGWPPGF